MNKLNGYMFFLNMFCCMLIALFCIKTCNKQNGNSVLQNYNTLHSDTTINNTYITNQYTKNSTTLRPVDSIVVVPYGITVDTAQIIAQWQKKYYYHDHYKDTLLDLFVFDTTYQNKIIGRSIKYTATIPTRTITNTVQQKWRFSAGAVGSASNVGPSLLVNHKKWTVQTTYLLFKQQNSANFGLPNQFQIGLYKQFN